MNHWAYSSQPINCLWSNEALAHCTTVTLSITDESWGLIKKHSVAKNQTCFHQGFRWILQGKREHWYWDTTTATTTTTTTITTTTTTTATIITTATTTVVKKGCSYSWRWNVTIIIRYYRLSHDVFDKTRVNLFPNISPATIWLPIHIQTYSKEWKPGKEIWLWTRN